MIIRPIMATLGLFVGGLILGCEDSATEEPKGQKPGSFMYMPTQATLTVGVPIDEIMTMPTSAGGAVDSYSVTPALPTGLAMSTTTGSITGTPEVESPQTTYTVTAANPHGTAMAEVQLTVNQVPPAQLSYSTPNAIYILNTAITANTPSSSGGLVTMWSIQPSLPAGLSFSTSTGAISGTPTALISATVFTVTASNSGGSTTAEVTISVVSSLSPPTGLSYTTADVTYSFGVAISANSPTVGGGPVQSYTIMPTLPAGLSLNTTSGVISGTPSAVAADASYTVTATNPAGSTTTGIMIEVVAVAPSGFSYAVSSATYAHPGTNISNLTPIISGGPITYSVMPALPAGIMLNTTTGVISGRPTGLSGATLYTIEASNGMGMVTAQITFTVVDANTLPVDAIGITGFAFTPNAQATQVGRAVRWMNNDSAIHFAQSLSSDWLDVPSYGMGGSQILGINKSGTLSYRCGVHTASMFGSLTVSP